MYLEQKRLSGTLALWTDVPPEAAESKQQDRILLLKGAPVAGKLLEPAATLREGLLRLFTRVSAPYAFYATNLLGDDRVSGRVDPLSLIAESLRTTARDDVVQQVLGRFAQSALGLQPSFEVERYDLQPSECALIDLLRSHPADMESLIAASALPEQYTRRLLYLLAITKALVPVANAPTVSATPASEPPPAKSVAPSAAGALPSMTSPKTSLRPRASGAPSGGRESLHGALDRLQSIPPPPETLGDEARQRWLRIVAKGRLIENQNYFEMLDLDKDAKSGDARAKFYSLAKEWHPDRLPAEMVQLREYVQIIFSYMSEASAALSDENQRVQYVQTVREGGGTPATERLMQAILDTAMEYERVLVLSRKHQYDDAIEVMKKILSVMKDDAEYHAMYAWLLMQKFPGQGQEAPLQKMLESVDKALSLHDRHERANLLKAQILRRMGRQDEAFDYFRRVSEINPRNIDAMREVRVANMRAGADSRGARTGAKPGAKGKGKQKAPEPGGVGALFGKLFKK